MSDDAARDDVDRCPTCGYVFPEIVAVGAKPDTVSGITDFAVVQECPRCLTMSTAEISVEQLGVGEEPPGGVPPKRTRGNPN